MFMHNSAGYMPNVTDDILCHVMLNVMKRHVLMAVVDESTAKTKR